MRPPEDEIRRLVSEWIGKADLDFRTVLRLSAEGEFRDIVAFHAQQAAEKYLKGLLTRHQIEFPKTHVIRRLLILLQPIDSATAQALDEASWLSPFGADIRYPGDRPETLPGDEARAHQLAKKVRNAVMAVLDPYLAGR
ncbi:MAG: HEPN domain-containing protein [Bryobacteraceae bacterium]